MTAYEFFEQVMGLLGRGVVKKQESSAETQCRRRVLMLAV